MIPDQYEPTNYSYTHHIYKDGYYQQGYPLGDDGRDGQLLPVRLNGDRG
jgi:hypothetical protein